MSVVILLELPLIYLPFFVGRSTVMMDAIASELPDGAWKMLGLPNGQVRVTLSWRLS
ncbi:hypothetical protein [Nostoc sp.]|uniref:hypothetical protein n=1 Tax=Nostoc sp. TaxID=1180 RepID=UPI002FFC5216